MSTPTAAGGSYYLVGNVVDAGRLELGVGATLTHLQGNFSQTTSGTIQTDIASVASYGVLSDSDTPTLAGTLAVDTVAPFKPTIGQIYTIVTSPSISGTFSKYTGVASGSLVYQIVYTPSTNVHLQVAKPSIGLSVNAGHAGSSVTVTGDGWFPMNKEKIFFTDSHGTKTPLAAATADVNGEFTVTVTVPPG